MHVQNWDDYRFVAVLARTGSLTETSRLLGVDRSEVVGRGMLRFVPPEDRARMEARRLKF